MFTVERRLETGFKSNYLFYYLIQNNNKSSSPPLTKLTYNTNLPLPRKFHTDDVTRRYETLRRGNLVQIPSYNK